VALTDDPFHNRASFGVDRLRNFLRTFLAAAGVTFKVHGHSPIVSFSDAKSVLPFDPGSMLKGLAFNFSNQTYAIIGLRADDRHFYPTL
jgi:Cys-tRNA(Pro)/Cys-tRNA(Cys) deacylase